jgi:hypothetical protein
MKNLLVVCLILTLVTLGVAQTAKPELFTTAEELGDPQRLTFFRWSTSAGGYLLRHDGIGEFTSHQSIRRVFYVTMGPKGRIDRVYCLEHERDLFLLYEIKGHGFYLVRIEQTDRTRRKTRWFTPLGKLSGEDPSLDGDVIRVGKTIEVSKADGRILKQG